MRALSVGALLFWHLGATGQEAPNRIADQDQWITNNQVFSVLSLDYEVEPQQGWLAVSDGANRFFLQANDRFPELRMMQAWANTVNITTDELNVLNNQLLGGRLFLTPENKLQLVVEQSYYGMKMTTMGLVKSVEHFRDIRDQAVELISNL